MPYGICPVCRKERKLGGTKLRKHNKWDPVQKKMVECGGTRCEPVKVTAH